jgi:hypothetical protein
MVSNAVVPRRLTRQICRSRAPCEYAERARTRAQIICARTSGRRAVGIAPYRRILFRARPLRRRTDRPIRCISLMGEVGQAPLRARRARARTRCSTTGLAAPQGQLSARRGRVPGRASPERRGSSPRMCSRGSAKPSWTRRNDRGQRRGPSHARGDALPLRDRREPRRHHEAGGPLSGQLLANYWTPRDVQDGTRRNKYPT